MNGRGKTLAFPFFFGAVDILERKITSVDKAVLLSR